MKTKTILHSLLLMIPINVAAHPGHAPDAAFAGLTGAQLWWLSALAGIGLAVVATRLRRRRKNLRLDD